LITVTLVLALLLIGYLGFRWLKHTVYYAVDAELVESGIYNVRFEGVTLTWFGADIRSLRFDLEKAGQRQSVSLSDISIQSSLTSIKQRRILSLGVGELTVVVEKITPQISGESVGVEIANFPIPSDLFLLLPADSVEINQYKVRHIDDHWRVHSDQGVAITQGLLLTYFSFFYLELPEIKVKLQLNAKNKIVINLVPSLSNANPSIQPVLMRLESEISGHYKQLSTSLSIDVDIKESIDRSAFVQEHVDRLAGKDVLFSKGQLQMSANVTINIEELLQDIKVDNVHNIISSVRGQGELQLNDINVLGQGKSFSGLNGVLNFDVDDSMLSFSTEDMVVKTVSAGVEIDSVDSVFSGFFDITELAYQVNVASVDGHVLGGSMSLLPFSVTGPILNSEFEMQFNNVELHKLLELQSNQDLSGEGQLSGFIQVSINESVIEIPDGHFGSKNGYIRYQRNSVVDAVSDSNGQQQLAFVLDAMEDFQYNSLETGVTLKAPDNLYLAIAMKGFNSNVKHGQMLHLNLNLEQNIGPLIQAANIDSALQDNLLK